MEAAEPAIRAEERLREGGVPAADVFRVALIAEGDEEKARAWVQAYAEADAREAIRRHHGQS